MTLCENNNYNTLKVWGGGGLIPTIGKSKQEIIDTNGNSFFRFAQELSTPSLNGTAVSAHM